ncbi:lipopolysaccharide biosynthesis protein [Caballeronia glebae]|uniref:Polysaccharide biosynthesis protein n=1 Tax=Caballeronia glebae TaxID=1777143 RepID=A0A158C4W0_9BURK|nr:oligosaccharide flippase family protein [Caballeronia glebae]SAK77394.1 polysaccharide biosynthesis protein [Caballeronia glebae]
MTLDGMFGARLMRVANVSLRGLTLASKFILLLVMAKFMTLSEVGQYGVLAATVSYALFILGLDFYTYSTREMLSVDQILWPSLLRNQAAFFAVCYATMLPVFYLALKWSDTVSERLVLWFLVLVVLEHLAQELTRLLVAMSRPVSATVLGFLRGGLWACACIAVMVVAPALRNIETVLIAWVLGSLCASCFGFACIRGLPWSVATKRPVDWRWIWRGVRICTPLLVATLAIRGISVFDRYMQGYFAGDEALGVYTFYAGVANAIQAFLDAAVFSFLYPRLVKGAKSEDRSIFDAAVSQLTRATVLTTTVLSFVALVGIKPVLTLLRKPIYAEHFGMFLWILSGVVLFSLSMIPHYVLYATRQDRAILATNLISLVVFIVAAPLLAPHLKSLAVPVALTVAFGTMYVSKLALCRKFGMRR